jgi:hypothetical protein
MAMSAARLPRGLRNRNPGNIRSGDVLWEGQTGCDADGFCTFASDEDGIRALAKLLVGYYRRQGLDTVRGIIRRYAPASENDTQAYVTAVARRLGVAAESRLRVDEPETLTGLVKAILRHENGAAGIYPGDVVAAGVRRALA